MRKIGKYLLSILPLLVMLMIQVVFSLGISVRYILMYGVEEGGVLYMENVSGVLALIHGINLLIMGFWYYLFAIHRKKKAGASLAGLFDWKCIGYIVMLGFGAQLLISLLMGAWQLLSPEMMAEYNEMMEESGIAQISILSILSTVIFAPVGEELVFRGLTLEYLKRAGARFWVANVVQALFFGIAHMNLIQGSYAFLLGLLCGYVVLKYDSIAAGIALHLIFNAYGTFVTPVLNLIFGGADAEWSVLSNIIYYVVCIVLGGILFVYGLRLVKKDLETKAAE